MVALLEDARAFADVPGLERALEQGGDARDDERGVAGGLGIMVRQRNESFQPFADDIRVRELGLVRKRFPGGIEKRTGGGGDAKDEKKKDEKGK